MSPFRTATLICAAVVLLFAAGCSSESDPPAVVASVTLQNLQPEPLQTGTDKQPVNNCDGTGDATYTISKEREISHLLEVDSEFSVNADGAVKVFGTGIGLGAAVASKVGATYGKRDTVERKIEITVKPKTMVQYEVSLQDVYQVGEAEITVGSQSTTIPFRFFSDFVLVLLGTRELECPGIPTALPTFTIAPDSGTTPAAQPTEPPTPTATQVPPTVTSTPTAAAQTSDTPTPPTAPSSQLPGCGFALSAGETRNVKPGTYIVGDIVIDGIQQHDSRVGEGTVAYFERPASVFAEWGAGCYSGGADLMSKVVAREFTQGCGPDNGCAKVRVVYVRADGTQEALCKYPDNSTQLVQRAGTDSWCP